MRYFINLTLGIIFLSTSGHSQNCDELFESYKPKINDLQKVVHCNSSFTVNECASNIGVVAKSAVVLAGVGIGFKSGYNMVVKEPQFCSLKGKRGAWQIFLGSEAFAACDDLVSRHAYELDGVLDTDEKLRKYQAGQLLIAQIEKDFPEISSATSEAAKIRDLYMRDGEIVTAPKIDPATGKYIMDPKTKLPILEKQKITSTYLKSLDTAFGAQFGFKNVFSTSTPCEYVKSDSYSANPKFGKCDLFLILRNSRLPYENTNSTIVAFENAREFYSNPMGSDSEDMRKFKNYFQDQFNGPISKVEALRLKIKGGLVTSVSQLESLFQDTSKAVSPVLKSQLASVADRASKYIPKSKVIESLSGSLKSQFNSAITTDVLKNLKKGLPLAIVSLLPLAANAANCSGWGKVCSQAQQTVEVLAKAIEETDPDRVLRMKTLGCAQVTSDFSTIDENCQEVVGFTPNIQTFLLSDEATQKSQICRHRKFELALNQLHKNTFRSAQATCTASGVKFKDGNTSQSQFTFRGDQLTSATINHKLEDAYGYDLTFDIKGSIVWAKIKSDSGGRTGTYYDRAKLANNEKVQPSLDDFSTRLPQALMAWKKCQENSQENLNDGSRGSTLITK